MVKEYLRNVEPVNSLFDQVWVLSLKSSSERRRHVREHLPKFGINEFQFFDAIEADNPEVEEVQMKGEVFRYPPCFRCGQLDCGNPDCNNFLIPAQIACFLSFRHLWQTIVEGTAGRVLIMEDDIFLHPQTHRVLSWLRNKVDEGLIPFQAENNCLLRLGWARCEDHLNDNAPVGISETVKMANPCHAITRSFAEALVKRYQGITHTVDVYQHQLAPRPGEAFTIFPPIASELSWTEGRFSSTIHPKKVHIDYLRQIGDESAMETADKHLASHIKKKHFRTLLITGHPRCGIGYAAALCGQLGLDIGHEKAGKDGISSWMFAVDDKNNPWASDLIASSRQRLVWKYLIMPVRDMGKAAESVTRESEFAPMSYKFRREHILHILNVDLDSFDTPLEQSVYSIVCWVRIVFKQSDFVFRIEDEHERLREFLDFHNLIDIDHRHICLDTSPINANKLYKGKHYDKPTFSVDDWKSLPKPALAEATWYCDQFGYPYPWEQL